MQWLLMWMTLFHVSITLCLFCVNSTKLNFTARSSGWELFGKLNAIVHQLSYYAMLHLKVKFYVVMRVADCIKNIWK